MQLFRNSVHSETCDDQGHHDDVILGLTYRLSVSSSDCLPQDCTFTVNIKTVLCAVTR